MTRNQRVRWIYGWELFKLSHYPAKFGGYRHGGNGDMFLVVEEQDSTLSLNSTITIFLWSACSVMVTYTKFYNKNVDENIYLCV